MANNQFENSRISESTLRSKRPAPQESATDLEISNMIAEGGPATPAGAAPLVNRAGMRDGARGLSAASTLMGHRVLTAAGEELGNIEEIMLDLRSGRIAYAVLSFSGFPGIANKRFPVPWNALRIDPTELILDMDRKTFEGAPDFDKGNLPDMADPAFGRAVHKHYGRRPYWENTAADAGVPLSVRQETESNQRSETRH
jgi:sporulation protein YlmC with PRC-barrel domain